MAGFAPDGPSMESGRDGRPAAAPLAPHVAATAQISKWQILLQKSFGASPRERLQNSIPTRVRWRTKIPQGALDPVCDSISHPIYQTADRLLQQNQHTTS